MSRDKYSNPEADIDHIARVRAGNIAAFMGAHRPPHYPDELDATSVVDLMFPSTARARIKFVKDHGDMLRVVYLPAP